MNTYITINSKYKTIGRLEIEIQPNDTEQNDVKPPNLNIFTNVLSNNKIFFLASLIVPLVHGSNTCRLKCLKGLYVLIRMYLNGCKNEEEFADVVSAVDKNILDGQADEKNAPFKTVNRLGVDESNKTGSNTDKSTGRNYKNVSTYRQPSKNLNNYELKDANFYKKLYVYYYFAVATYSSPLVLFQIKPQIKVVTNVAKEEKDAVLEHSAQAKMDTLRFTKTLDSFISGDVPRVLINNISKLRARILSFLNIKDSNLLEIKLNDAVPHLKFIHKNKLVVSFRGTESAEDILADVSCDYVEFLDGYAHRGILELAKKFLEEHENVINCYMKTMKLKKIVFVGHSLGGAIASLVSILLTIKNCTYPTSVMSFSSPPFLSYNLAKRFNSVRIFVLGSDVFPRLSYGSVLDFKYLTAAIGTADNLIKENDARLLRLFIKKVKKHLRRSELHPKLFLPGRIYHMRADRHYLYVSKVKRTSFDGIIVDADFFKDHMPSVFLSKIKNTVIRLLKNDERKVK
ncbi:putative lipase/calmodulin-binding heat-shock protein [Trachipleistophora hominis]|uniref:sn-1-specific diacylglycerol lipase n=1 Tax=Trachipleistophora hominis TaxID=72359 RepID=L7JUL9_TRAHO|nr:putative lipase/calmodulin-binding heat-shock protein [Trachipleistophora hominis]